MKNIQKSILIPYTTESVDEESYFEERDTLIHAAYCLNDESQIFIKTTRKLSGNDSEPLLCPFCKESLYRGHGLSEFVLSTTTPEVIGCLELKENKTLSLVVQKSCSDNEMDAIRAILDRHNFTKFAKKINVFQHLKNFRAILKPLNKKEFLLLKNLRKLFCVNLKAPKKLKLSERKKLERKDENINLAAKSRKLISKRSLDQIRKQWTNLPTTIPKFQAKSKKGMKKKLFLSPNMQKSTKHFKKRISEWSEMGTEFYQLKLLMPFLQDELYQLIKKTSH